MRCCVDQDTAVIELWAVWLLRCYWDIYDLGVETINLVVGQVYVASEPKLFFVPEFMDCFVCLKISC